MDTIVRLDSSVFDSIEKVVSELRRNQIVGSKSTCTAITKVILSVISLNYPENTTVGQVFDIVKVVGSLLQQAAPQLWIISGIVNRVCTLIVEEVNTVLKKIEKNDDISKNSTLKDFLVSKSIFSTDAVNEAGAHSSKAAVLDEESLKYLWSKELCDYVSEGIVELEGQVEVNIDVIADYSKEHINSVDPIMTIGYSSTVISVLKHIAESKKDLKLDVIVVNNLKNHNEYGAHQTAVELMAAGIHVTVISESSVFSVMPSVSKVIIPAAAISESGDVASYAGSLSVSTAAQLYKKPVLIISSSLKAISVKSVELLPMFNEVLDSSVLLPNSLGNSIGLVSTNIVTAPKWDAISKDSITFYITNSGVFTPKDAHLIFE